MGIKLGTRSTRLYGLNLSRCLGDKFLKDGDLGLSAAPHVSHVVRLPPRASGLVVLASDGLWDVASAARAVAVRPSLGRCMSWEMSQLLLLIRPSRQTRSARTAHAQVTEVLVCPSWRTRSARTVHAQVTEVAIPCEYLGCLSVYSIFWIRAFITISPGSLSGPPRDFC